MLRSGYSLLTANYGMRQSSSPGPERRYDGPTAEYWERGASSRGTHQLGVTGMDPRWTHHAHQSEPHVQPVHGIDLNLNDLRIKEDDVETPDFGPAQYSGGRCGFR